MNKGNQLKLWAGDILDAATLDDDNIAEAIAGGLAKKLCQSLPGFYFSFLSTDIFYQLAVNLFIYVSIFIYFSIYLSTSN